MERSKVGSCLAFLIGEGLTQGHGQGRVPWWKPASRWQGLCSHKLDEETRCYSPKKGGADRFQTPLPCPTQLQNRQHFEKEEKMKAHAEVSLPSNRDVSGWLRHKLQLKTLRSVEPFHPPPTSPHTAMTPTSHLLGCRAGDISVQSLMHQDACGLRRCSPPGPKVLGHPAQPLCNVFVAFI